MPKFFDPKNKDEVAKAKALMIDAFVAIREEVSSYYTHFLTSNLQPEPTPTHTTSKYGSDYDSDDEARMGKYTLTTPPKVTKETEAKDKALDELKKNVDILFSKIQPADSSLPVGDPLEQKMADLGDKIIKKAEVRLGRELYQEEIHSACYADKEYGKLLRERTILLTKGIPITEMVSAFETFNTKFNQLRPELEKRRDSKLHEKIQAILDWLAKLHPIFSGVTGRRMTHGVEGHIEKVPKPK